MGNDLIERLKETSLRIRYHIIDMAYSTGNDGAHLGGSLSMVELLACLYCEVINYDKDDTQWEGRDRVILSKGHAALALYPALVEGGIIDESELLTYKKNGSRLGVHPSLNGLPGIEFASGSLGQGLSLGVGTALALKRKNNIDSRVFVFLGDGECDEGSVWEAAASAAHYKLDQIVAVIDQNNLQYDGYTSEIMNMNSLESKWKSFGWDTFSIDGHNIEDIIRSYKVRGNKPLAILAKTVKGKGISIMENQKEYHNARLTKELYDQAIEELRGVIC